MAEILPVPLAVENFSPTMNARTDKPDLVRKWKTEESDLSGDRDWTILIQAARMRGEEILGMCWVPMDDFEAEASTVCFHHNGATALFRTLYSTFTALEDPEDYLKQIGLGWTLDGGRPPSSGMVGSVQGHGSFQVHVDWKDEPRHSTFMIYPPDSPRVHVVLGIESVAHIIQCVTEAFVALDWPVPA